MTELHSPGSNPSWLLPPDSNRTHFVTPQNLLKTSESDLFVLIDVARYEIARVAKGRVKIVVPERAKTIKNRQRRYRILHPPAIQTILKRAYELRGYFVTAPHLTKDALAKREGMSPSYLSRILNLLNLAPAIQNHIMELPPGRTKGPITESRLKHIARMSDHQAQIRAFELVKNRPIRCLPSKDPGDPRTLSKSEAPVLFCKIIA